MDVLVIGGGVVGAATALALTRRELSVALVERSRLARAEGSSRGTARIFTPAAYPDESYLEMGLRALERWREIEHESGERLLVQNGALSLGAFAEEEMPALQEVGVEAELLTAEQAMESFGVSVPADTPILFQPDAGIICADRARKVLLRLAAAAGAELGEREQVLSIVPGRDSVEVETDRERWSCSSVVVAAGPWSGVLLAQAGVFPSLSVSSQSVAYFRLADESARPVAVMEFDGDEPYALWDPQNGLKAALHARGPLVAPEHRRARALGAADRARERVGRRALPGPHHRPHRGGGLPVHEHSRRALHPPAARPRGRRLRLQRPGLPVRSRDG